MPADTPEELHALLSMAMNSGDLDALIALYEEDATLTVPPEGRPVTGRDAIRDATAEVLALQPVADLRVVGKLQHDGLALTHGQLAPDRDRPGGRAGRARGPRHDGLAPPARRPLADRARRHDDAAIVRSGL